MRSSSDSPTKMKTFHNPNELLSIISISLMAFSTITLVPIVNAYGKEQWQTTFSGNCNAPAVPCPSFPPGRIGFWGWCTFGGGPAGDQPPGTEGVNGDCQFTVYISSSTTGPTIPVHIHQDITGWLIVTGSTFAPPGLPSFYLT